MWLGSRAGQSKEVIVNKAHKRELRTLEATRVDNRWQTRGTSLWAFGPALGYTLC